MYVFYFPSPALESDTYCTNLHWYGLPGIHTNTKCKRTELALAAYFYRVVIIVCDFIYCSTIHNKYMYVYTKCYPTYIYIRRHSIVRLSRVCVFVCVRVYKC